MKALIVTFSNLQSKQESNLFWVLRVKLHLAGENHRPLLQVECLIYHCVVLQIFHYLGLP